MEPVAVVILLALVEYVAFGGLVGRARGKYGVNAPAVSGHEVFERYFRVHQNTLELLVVFVPAMWLFGTYVNPTWAALLGLVFVVGRVLYLLGYVKDPAKREIGFGAQRAARSWCCCSARCGVSRGSSSERAACCLDDRASRLARPAAAAAPAPHGVPCAPRAAR